MIARMTREAEDLERELGKAHEVLANVARILRTPRAAIVDTIWIDDNPKGIHVTLYEQVVGALPPDHPEVLIAMNGGAVA